MGGGETQFPIIGQTLKPKCTAPENLVVILLHNFRNAPALPSVSNTSFGGLSLSTPAPQPLATVLKQTFSAVTTPPIITPPKSATSNSSNQVALSAFVLPAPSKGEFEILLKLKGMVSNGRLEIRVKVLKY